MLITTAVGEHAKVLDFGIAKITESDGKFDGGLTAPDLVIGTPQYMSPEQCSQSEQIDARSDIYSFGVILYELLVGHVPFSGDSATAIMMKHLQEPVPSVLDERDDIPPVMAKVVARALAKVPANRYQNVSELLDDLTVAGETPFQPVTKTTSTRPPVQVPSTDIDDDEVTVVRPRQVERLEPQPSQRRASVTVPIQQEVQPAPPPVGFNPLKILIPSAVALLVVFAVIYAVTRNSSPTANTNTNQSNQSLVADPNSQPVQPSQPPTGKGEEGIPAGGSVNAPTNENLNANLNANASPSVGPSIEVSPVANSNANENDNSNRKAPALPSPTRVVTPDEAPALPPSPAKSPATKPSPTTPVPSPTDPPR